VFLHNTPSRIGGACITEWQIGTASLTLVIKKKDKEASKVCRVRSAYMYCPYVLEGKAIAFPWPVEILVALQNTRTPRIPTSKPS